VWFDVLSASSIDALERNIATDQQKMLLDTWPTVQGALGHWVHIHSII
jgi:hypothetical protein